MCVTSSDIKGIMISIVFIYFCNNRPLFSRFCNTFESWAVCLLTAIFWQEFSVLYGNFNFLVIGVIKLNNRNKNKAHILFLSKISRFISKLRIIFV